MRILNINITFKEFVGRFITVFAIAIIATLFIGIYVLGLFVGYISGKNDNQKEYISYLTQLEATSTPMPTIKPSQTQVTPAKHPSVKWGGPDLWNAVNKRRVELGVNSLQQRDELCTIASIRLNELLDLGTLDSHEGFSKLSDERKDLQWIFEKYSTMAEFLAVGGDTPEETVALWENTLGHKKLLTGGEYVWGCIYAQDTFAVTITAF